MPLFDPTIIEKEAALLSNLDQSKAIYRYNLISWRLSSLRPDSSRIFYSWIHLLYESPGGWELVSIKVYNFAHNRFPKCPLSPLLYVLAMEHFRAI